MGTQGPMQISIRLDGAERKEYYVENMSYGLMSATKQPIALVGHSGKNENM